MQNQPIHDDFSSFLAVSKQAAKSAGEFLLTKMGQVTVMEKNPGDFVTQADIESQQIIQDMISTKFPDHGFLGEEQISSESANTVENAEFCWIVDPIDGTTNFIHQLPSFSVSIALRHHREMVLGCIYDPILDEMFVATRGGGAFLNGKAIETSRATTSARTIVVCSLPRQLTRESTELIQLNNVLCDSEATVRRLGSAALNLCYIACGRVDAYWSTLAKIWDIAAGVVILEEAGGVIEDINGGHLRWDDIQFVAAATHELNQELIGHLMV